MKYKFLHNIINQIKKDLRCSRCAKLFRTDNVELYDVYEDEAFLVLFCDDKCNSKMEVVVSLKIGGFVTVPAIDNYINDSLNCIIIEGAPVKSLLQNQNYQTIQIPLKMPIKI